MTTLTVGAETTSPLTDDMLLRFRERAPGYDRDNRFFDEDFEELRAAGYLKINVPKDLGGQGHSLAEVAQQQRRLAYYAPATALAVNMHLYWVGVAGDLRRFGDRSLEWMLREAAAGEVFAAGHGEVGNDLPVLLSTAKAEKVDAATDSPVTRCSAASHRCGRASASMPWTLRTRRRRKSSTPSSPAAALATR